MSGKSKSKQQATPVTSSASPAAIVLGTLFLALCVVMSFMLVVEHFGANLPGCGEGSPCEQAANSVWGKVPVVNWPVSFLGLAYFLAALVTWLVARGALPTHLRNVARLGALGSLFFCVILVFEHMLCGYCLAAHLGNFAFWFTVELTGARTRRPTPAVATAGSLFVLASLIMGVSDWRQRESIRQQGEVDLDASIKAMIDRSQQTGGEAVVKPPTKPAPATQPAPAPEVAEAQPQTLPPPAEPEPAEEAVAEPVEREGLPPFTGRYRRGPEAAPIRIVMYTGYQCPDCNRVEPQVRRLLQRDDVSVSIKHFPFCSDCNPHIRRTTQPNGCWAARAAEAAGILWGNEGFWKMHDWLFDHRGAFTKLEQLKEAFHDPDYNVGAFRRLVVSDRTLELVRQDCNEAKEYGLYFSPMIFINGVELRGWHVHNALIRAVDELSKTNPPPSTADHDHPPLAVEKYVSDWREQDVLTLPADKYARSLGAAEPVVDIVVWGGFEEPNTAQADIAARAFVAGREDARYTFRHYPFNSDCNSNISDQRHPNACTMSFAAEAAEHLGGMEVYWKMHAWLMEHHDSFSEEALRAAATEMGLDADKLLETMATADVQAAIADDIEMAKTLPRLRLGMPKGLHSIPGVFVNNKHVPRWTLPGEDVLGRILKEAAGQAP